MNYYWRNIKNTNSEGMGGELTIKYMKDIKEDGKTFVEFISKLKQNRVIMRHYTNCGKVLATLIVGDYYTTELAIEVTMSLNGIAREMGIYKNF